MPVKHFKQLLRNKFNLKKSAELFLLIPNKKSYKVTEKSNNASSDRLCPSILLSDSENVRDVACLGNWEQVSLSLYY